MFGRRGSFRVFVFVFLLAGSFFFYTPHGSRAQNEPAAAQEQPQQSRRMRRAKGQQPRSPAAPRRAPNQTSSAESDDEVVRVDTDLATVLLTAIDRDRRFVTTLRKEDVRVAEDNVAQEISVFERETDLPLTLSILVDTSRSQEQVLPDEKAAARSFIDSVIRPLQDQASVISFTGEAVLLQELTNDPGKLHRAVESVTIELPTGDPRCDENVSPEREPRCFTGVWDAVWVTVDEVLSQTPERTRRAIILLSDGDDTSSKTKRQEAIDLALKHNVVIYSIGIHDYGSEGELADDALRKISEKTGGRAFFPEDKASLAAAFAQIQAELRSQYLVAYQPLNRKRDGSFRQVRVEIVNPELKKQKLRLLYRQGYYAKQG